LFKNILHFLKKKEDSLFFNYNLLMFTITQHEIRHLILACLRFAISFLLLRSSCTVHCLEAYGDECRGAGGFWRTYSAPDLATPEAFDANPSLGTVGSCAHRNS
jgi:hypothetical protein